MSWKKCPYGCVFEVEDKDWQSKVLLSTFTCKICHRPNPPGKFTVAIGGAATNITNRAQITSMSVGRGYDDEIKDRISRLIQVPGFFESTRKRNVDTIYNQLVQLLMNAELNSNFKAKSIIGLLGSGVMKNMWAFAVTDPVYAEERDKGERQIFGSLSQDIRGSENPVAAYRPVYITLNIGNLQQGGASMYGFSYFVYRDAVKLRSTFIATDSLQMIRGEGRKAEGERVGVGLHDLATYSSIPRVLLRVSDMRFRYLCFQAGGTAASYNDEFIEAHGWGEINLAEDVKAMIISEPELQEFLSTKPSMADGVPDTFKNLDGSARIQALAALKQDLTNFCSKNRIELQFLTLNATTTRGGTGRPKV